MDKKADPGPQTSKRPRPLIMCNGVKLDKDAMHREGKEDFLEEGVCSKRQSR